MGCVCARARVPAASGAAPPSMQANLGHQPQNLQEQPVVEGGEASAAQPAQAAVPSCSCFEAIDTEDHHVLSHTDRIVEHEIIEDILQLATGQGEPSHQGEEASIDDSNVPQIPTSDINRLRNNQHVQAASGAAPLSMQANLGHRPQNLQEQPVVEGGEASAAQPAQAAVPNPSYFELIDIEDAHLLLHTNRCVEHEIIEDILRRATRQREASHQGEEASIDDRSVQQIPTSDIHRLRNNQAETSHQGEEAGRDDRVVPQATPPVDMDSIRSAGLVEHEPVDDEEGTCVQAREGQQRTQDGPPQQGTAGRRMRLQIKKTSFLHAEPADLLCKDVICFSARTTKKVEGDWMGSSSIAEGLVACTTNSDDLDESQKSSQDAFGSSILGLLLVCIFRSFCRLTRMAFTHV